ncbi:hypothetical protein KQH49_06355 [Mycetohabitans sp. B5]|uniref:Uncharacterized protein n=1 Tax=Mycetohabitans endofungorum TaxID=417203 RepID=A0A2P5K7B9_9BURK|nr:MULTISPECIES: hypothetical protein [Mycetohabitans]MCG1054598.1 hypothetical protein [Mycetohabitans sp. B5]PPB81976.1 hypothetical protein B0O95_11635 [Mycetohabitans endofungorum]
MPVGYGLLWVAVAADGDKLSQRRDDYSVFIYLSVLLSFDAGNDILAGTHCR